MIGRDRLAGLLPALDRWDLRRIDGAVTFKTVAGGAAGYLIGGSVGIPLAFLASTVRRLLGWPFGHVAKAAGFLLAAYILAVAASRWTDPPPKSPTDGARGAKTTDSGGDKNGSN